MKSNVSSQLNTNSFKELFEIADSLNVFKKTPHPICDYILVKDGIIYADNLEFNVQTQLQVNTNLFCLIPARELKSFISFNKTLKIELVGNIVHLSGDFSDIYLETLDPIDFLKLPFGNFIKIDELTPLDCKKVVDAAPFCSQDMLRPNLRCIYVTNNEIVGSDAQSLFVDHRVNCKNKPIHYSLPNIPSFFGKGSSTVSILFASKSNMKSKMLRLVKNKTSVTFKIEEDNFPYESSMAFGDTSIRTLEHTFSFSKDVFLRALKGASSHNTFVDLVFEDKTISMQTIGENGDIKYNASFYSVNSSTERIVKRFDNKVLLKSINAIENGLVTFRTYKEDLSYLYAGRCLLLAMEIPKDQTKADLKMQEV